MKPGKIITSDSEFTEMLQHLNTVAVVGLSPKPERDSYRVARYLQQRGITIIPIRPGQKEILGAKAYPSLDDVPVPIDIVDVFRNSDKVLAHAHEALRLEPRVFWMQLNIENLEAAELLTTAGIDVVMNRCIKIEYERLFNRTGQK
ncbi:MAG: CoA-binding protein [Desulfobacterales bacterium]|nr:CoA-binding protein [Desulfobacterales bacterium]